MQFPSISSDWLIFAPSSLLALDLLDEAFSEPARSTSDSFEITVSLSSPSALSTQ